MNFFFLLFFMWPGATDLGIFGVLGFFHLTSLNYGRTGRVATGPTARCPLRACARHGPSETGKL